MIPRGPRLPRLPRRLLLFALALALGACRARDPSAELAVENLETYWVVDTAVGQTSYIAPAVRFEVRNKGVAPQGGVQATAAFKRKGETESWGSDWKQVVPAGKPLLPGASILVVLRSDARYFSPGGPESMLSHEKFKDATVEVFLRLGASSWVKFASLDVERTIGAKSARTDAR